MCGFAGHAGRRPLAPIGQDVVDALRHRGPDAQCVERHVAGDVTVDLAFARLAIVDLSRAGDQPMSSEDGRYTLVFNGEIYNSPDLRDECERLGHKFRSAMDGEVILHLWEMKGSAALQRLNGIFAVAMVDSLTGELYLARDPVGVKPLVYATSGDQVWFASELRALTAMGAPTGGEDTVALAQFLSFLWIPDPRTPYRNVRSIEPGSVVRWKSSGVDASRYCERLHPSESPVDLDPGSAVRELRQRLTAAVHRQFMGDVPIALMASGGIDSSLIWDAADGRIERAYTIAWSGTTGSERLSEDTESARSLGNRFGTPVTCLSGEGASDHMPRGGDLLADPSYALTRAISQRASSDGVKVLLSGHGGDELFAGYRRHRIAPYLRRLRLAAPTVSACRAIAGLGGGLSAEYLTRLTRAVRERDLFASYMQLCTYSDAAERARLLDCDEREVGDAIVWQRHREVFDQLPTGVSYLRKVMALDLAVYLPGLGLAYTDRASMEHGVEVRVPWLDLELLRWSLTLPDSLLVRGGREKWLPRELSAIRISSRQASRAKRGFAAPAHRVAAGLTAGSRGFRQGRYFALATSMLERHHATAHRGSR